MYQAGGTGYMPVFGAQIDDNTTPESPQIKDKALYEASVEMSALSHQSAMQHEKEKQQVDINNLLAPLTGGGGLGDLFQPLSNIGTTAVIVGGVVVYMLLRR